MEINTILGFDGFSLKPVCALRELSLGICFGFCYGESMNPPNPERSASQPDARASDKANGSVEIGALAGSLKCWDYHPLIAVSEISW